jgi:hypothetical protein
MNQLHWQNNRNTNNYEQTKFEAPDLTQRHPRSPRCRFSGFYPNSAYAQAQGNPELLLTSNNASLLLQDYVESERSVSNASRTVALFCSGVDSIM